MPHLNTTHRNVLYCIVLYYTVLCCVVLRCVDHSTGAQVKKTYINQLVNLPFDGKRNHDFVLALVSFQSLFNIFQDLHGLLEKVTHKYCQ